ncbi:hypothetical protein [Maribacter stanieri]|uniref:Uncharacterized protein n=1 Tax=Maribacter stanieri TaxID=440514 RepID=A0A1I6I6I2_9FLAO|nr:hypothetical protein [Maribacter stanieri]SFR62313.1 hypothetical protein SAMN04488010_1198 [Maribacter stanieri]
MTQIEDNVIHAILFDDELFNSYLYQLINLLDNSFWLGNKTEQKVTELHIFLFNNISNYIKEELPSEMKKKKS